MFIGKRLFGISLLVFLIAPWPPDALASQQPPELTYGPDVFAAREVPQFIHETVCKTKVPYTKSKGHLRLADHTGDIHIDYYYYRSFTSDSGAATPLLIIYSGLLGVGVLEKKLAHYFAKNGVSVVISHYLELESSLHLENLTRSLARTIKAGVGLTDYFAALPEINREQIAVLGVSYGGIRAVYHMGVDSRLKAATLMVAGAPLDEVLAFSKLPLVTFIRREQMLHAGIETLPQYLAQTKPTVSMFDENYHFVDRPADDFYLFIGKKDRDVPTTNQWALWESLGRPPFEVRSFGHTGTPVWAGVSRIKDIHAFFEAHWHR